MEINTSLHFTHLHLAASWPATAHLSLQKTCSKTQYSDDGTDSWLGFLSTKKRKHGNSLHAGLKHHHELVNTDWEPHDHAPAFLGSRRPWPLHEQLKPKPLSYPQSILTLPLPLTASVICETGNTDYVPHPGLAQDRGGLPRGTQFYCKVPLENHLRKSGFTVRRDNY